MWFVVMLILGRRVGDSLDLEGDRLQLLTVQYRHVDGGREEEWTGCCNRKAYGYGCRRAAL